MTSDVQGNTMQFPSSSNSKRLARLGAIASAAASLLGTGGIAWAAPPPDPVVSLRLEPPALSFANRRDNRRVLVLGITKGGLQVDLTDQARLTPQGGFVRHTSAGYLAPAKSGRGVVSVAAAGKVATLPVEVKNLGAPPVSFVRDVSPILARTGCNAGTCHGAQAGKNGFKLSLRGYDLDFDYHALVDDVAARRFNRADPDQSLMLLKPIQAVPHRGGLVFEKGSRYYALIRRWIAEGARSDVAATARVAGLEVLPKNPTLTLPGQKQNMVVLARYADGTTRDVTRDARYTSSVAEVAEVTDGGTVTAIRRGETALLVSYEGQFATNEFTILGDRSGFKWVAQPPLSYVDRLVDAKLRRMKALPAPLAGDADFLRRVYLDLTGLPPTAAQARQFLADPRPSGPRRAALIETLLQSPEFDDHWTYKFADLLQVNRKFLGDKGVQAFRAWIHDAIAANMPYDAMVRELITARGSSYENPAANYLRVIRETSTATESVTQLFLGVRFSCNKCHDHPFERWTQAQYYELGAYFAQVGFKPGQPGEELVYDTGAGEITFPRDGRVLKPQFPVRLASTEGPTAPSRREALAAWLTSGRNPFFAKSMANRIWSYFLGRGIIDPVDDIRASNPPSNPALLDALTDRFLKSGFNLRALMRDIVSSRTYQASISTNRWNEDDKVNFSHQVARRLTAEQLLDAISLAAGVVQRYPGVPYGTRAQQLPDTQVAGGSFLDLFGRPARESPCECERTSEVSLSQALNLMNGQTIADAIANPNGALPALLAKEPDNGRVVEELYLSVMARFPTAVEKDTAQKHLKNSANRLEGGQDLLWALLNSPAFLFNR